MDDATATLNGLTIGSGTMYEWTSWPTGLGTADIRTDDQERPRRQGIVAGDDLPGGRTVEFEIQVKGSRSEIEAALTALSAAFAPGSQDVWLGLRVSGVPAEYSLLGRPRGCAWALSKRFTHGLGDARCKFVAVDPVKYGAEETATITLGGGGGGLVYPVTYPVVYGGSSTSGVGSAVNAGLVAVEWSAVLSGPLLNPRLEHIESGRFVRVSAGIAVGESVTLDSRSAAILLGGTVPRPSWQAAGSSWFQLQPGGNSLRLTADTGAGNAVVSWRPGWP